MNILKMLGAIIIATILLITTVIAFLFHPLAAILYWIILYIIRRTISQNNQS